MGDLLNMFEKIKDSWQEWKSIPYVAIFLGVVYGWAVLKVDILKNPAGYLLLALVCLGILFVYIFLCALHVDREKQKAMGEGEALPKSKNKGKRALFDAGIIISLFVVIVSAYLLVSALTNKDGDYVIWADEYHMALTHEVYKNFYLSGEEVSARGDKLEDYPRGCVYELDFGKGGTFTMAYGGKLLGVTPGENGVGFSDACTSVLWKLEEVDEGVYYIVNVEENTYLKWYDHMQNWTTHPRITDDNRGQYMMCLEKVG